MFFCDAGWAALHLTFFAGFLVGACFVDDGVTFSWPSRRPFPEAAGLAVSAAYGLTGITERADVALVWLWYSRGYIATCRLWQRIA